MTKVFDKKGMMVFPNQQKKDCYCYEDKILVLEKCFCPNGHNLIDKRSSFNGFNGIVLKVKNKGIWGTVAISPIKKDSASIVFGLSIEKGDITEFHCPQCGIEIPVYTDCSCGAHVYCLFTNDASGYSDCIGICSRYGCYNSRVIEDLSHVGHRTSKIQQGR
jgi:hypothetical protein